MVGNPEDRFSHNEAHMVIFIFHAFANADMEHLSEVYMQLITD